MQKFDEQPDPETLDEKIIKNSLFDPSKVAKYISFLSTSCGINIGNDWNQSCFIGFFIFDVIFLSLGIILSLLFPHTFDSYLNTWGCPAKDPETCLAISSLYRLAATFVMFHTMLTLFHVLCERKHQMYTARAWWPFKAFMVFALYMCLLQAPNSSFEVYVGFSHFLSIFGAFMLQYKVEQVAYNWGLAFIDNRNCCWIVILTIAAFVTLIMMQIQLIGKYSRCDNVGAIIWVNFAFSLIRIIQGLIVSFIPAVFSVLFSTSLVWSALATLSGDSCTSSTPSSEVLTYQLAVGGGLFLMGLIGIGLIGFESEPKWHYKTLNHKRMREGWMVGFHFGLIFVYFYFGNMITNWGGMEFNNAHYGGLELEGIGYWIRIISSWAQIIHMCVSGFSFE